MHICSIECHYEILDTYPIAMDMMVPSEVICADVALRREVGNVG